MDRTFLLYFQTRIQIYIFNWKNSFHTSLLFALFSLNIKFLLNRIEYFNDVQFRFFSDF